MSLTTAKKRENRGFVLENPVPDPSIFVPTSCVLVIFGCFRRIHFSKTCDQSTVSVGNLRSAAGHILASPRLRTS